MVARSVPGGDAKRRIMEGSPAWSLATRGRYRVTKDLAERRAEFSEHVNDVVILTKEHKKRFTAILVAAGGGMKRGV